MRLKIKAVNPLEYPDWNSAVARLEGSSVFHTANWAGVLADSYGYRPHYVCAFEDNRLAGCLPLMDIRSFLTGRRGVSLPFTDQCPLLGGDRPFAALWKHAVEHGAKAGWKHIELRGAHRAAAGEPAPAAFKVHCLDLGRSESELLNRCRESTRRNIAKAVKNGVKVRYARSFEALRDFYALNCLTRRRHGLPPQPVRFFECIHDRIMSAGLGFVMTAAQAGKTIAAAVFFHFNGTVVYKYGASDAAHQHLRPNNLILWEAINWSNENRFSRFHFGRTEAGHHGLMQFKRGWGAEEKNLRYVKFDLKTRSFSSIHPKLKSSYPVLQRMPIPLLRVAGELLYRHVG